MATSYSNRIVLTKTLIIDRIIAIVNYYPENPSQLHVCFTAVFILFGSLFFNLLKHNNIHYWTRAICILCKFLIKLVF